MDDEPRKRRKKYSDEKDRMSIGINADTNGHAVPFTLSRQSACCETQHHLEKTLP